MAGDWPLRPLGELTENHDRIRVPVKEIDRRPGPYPYYGASGIVDYIDSYLLDGEYLLIAEDGENLRTRATPIAFLARDKFWVNNHAHVVRGNSEADTRFLMYALAKADISGYLTGSAMPKLTQGNMNRIPVPSPSLREQRAIADILGSLDYKIELNRQMSETMEEIARALFRSWFVNFDPVCAKTEGRAPGLTKPLADLFPNSFVESELGDIPAGWEVRGLDGIARFVNGLALQKFPPTDGRFLPVIKIAQLRTRNTDGAEKASADLEADYVVEDGDVLFSWSGSLECVLWTGGRGALNQHLFKVTSPQFPKWLYYLWIKQHLADFRHIAAAKATTMGHIQRHHLSEAKVVLPPPALLEAADRFIGPLVESITKCSVESRSLAHIRNALLPKLVSGEIRVKRLDRIIGLNR